jgi:hypothetical protein
MCSCGAERCVVAANLLAGKSNACRECSIHKPRLHWNSKDLTGTCLGEWVVVKPLRRRGVGVSWICTNSSGEERIFRWHNIRSILDPKFRIIQNYRGRVRGALLNGKASKSEKTHELLGCCGAQFVEYISLKLLPGMTLGNYGEWELDHIRPVASFDLGDPEQVKECFNFSNIQPLWAKDNRSKGSKYNGLRYSVTSGTNGNKASHHSLD